jgi:hypothetical protein
MLDFEDFTAAFDWVSADPARENAAYIDRTTHQLYWNLEDGSEDIPKDIADTTKYLPVPHKYDLDLGNALNLSFVKTHASDSYSEVSGFFKQRGAYSKFKQWLDQENLLETWYEYEATQTEQTLTQWLKTHSIPSS